MLTEVEFTSRLSLAILLGRLIGLERQWRQRTAGLRTNALVSTGAALFVMLAARAAGETSLPLIAAQVVSGIGFLGAGVIMREGLTVRGLNTAATLWCGAAVGTLAGAGWKMAAVVGAVAVLAIHLLLRPLAKRINQQPVDTSDVETSYRIRLVSRSQDESHIRALLLQTVSVAPLTLRSLQSEDEEDPSRVEVVANLISTGRNDPLLEQLVSRLSLESGVSAVSWEVTGQDGNAISEF